MIEVRQDWLDVDRQRCQMTLVEQSLNKLNMYLMKKGGYQGKNTYISSEVLSGNIRFHFQGITKHSGHGVLPENNNFLCKEFQATWIGCKVYFGDLCFQMGGEGRENGTTR